MIHDGWSGGERVSLNLPTTTTISPRLFNIQSTMVDDSASISHPPPSSNLRRRNSIGTAAIPTKLTLPSKAHYSSSFPRPNGVRVSSSTLSSSPQSSFPNVDFELISLKSLAYTSLKDLLPSTSAAQSPTAAGTGSGSCYEISIRNRLVKQAAWAYLQPMSASPGSSGGRLFDRMLLGFSMDCLRNRVSTCLGFINRHIFSAIIRAFDRILRMIGVRWPKLGKRVGVIYWS